MGQKTVTIDEKRIRRIVSESIRKILSETKTDWGGYYSDNSMGTRSWSPSTPEDAMSVAKSNGENPSDVYRKILNAKEIHREHELKDYGLPSDANLTNRRNLAKNQYYADPEYDRELERDKFNNPNLYRDRAEYTNEVPANHAERQKELQKTFKANAKKLNRYNRSINVNEDTIKKFIYEAIKEKINENESLYDKFKRLWYDESDDERDIFDFNDYDVKERFSFLWKIFGYQNFLELIISNCGSIIHGDILRKILMNSLELSSSDSINKSYYELNFLNLLKLVNHDIKAINGSVETKDDAIKVIQSIKYLHSLRSPLNDYRIDTHAHGYIIKSIRDLLPENMLKDVCKQCEKYINWNTNYFEN